MITKVRGHFADFDGTVTIAEEPLASTVEANVRLASVDTGSADRDTHLRTADFFGVEEHPEMTFRSTAIEESGDDYVLLGDLTIAGQTHPVRFDLEFDGVTTDPFGNTKAGFEATTDDRPHPMGTRLQHGARDRWRARLGEDPDRARHPARQALSRRGPGRDERRPSGRRSWLSSTVDGGIDRSDDLGQAALRAGWWSLPRSEPRVRSHRSWRSIQRRASRDEVRAGRPELNSALTATFIATT